MTKDSTRIISLIPSGTEILAALGLTKAIVGRSHECDFPPEILNLPVCTQARLNSNADSGEIHNQVNDLLQSALSIYQIKTDIFEQLQPTHIITQDQCDVCAVSFGEVENALKSLTNSSPQVISLQPDVLKDVWNDIKRVAQTFNVDSEPLLENLQHRIQIIDDKTQSLSTVNIPTVGCIEWTQPLMSASNWIPELVNYAGGKALFSSIGKPSQQFGWETFVEGNPDIIIFMPCGFDLNRTRTDAQLLTQKPEWMQLRAVKNDRVYITDGNSYFNRPGPRLVDSLEILAEIIHTEIFEYGYQGKAWEQLTVNS
ncbi:ABC-type Fe3+-hydroxamate transport system, periplasmic component [Rivularia sp. PCC 7116]|uniref:cobalamin-binding protein n=1 Tax=Rivularia sp. PCC 7116 TaxID=373994 RepID=UPI00029F43D0|nr:cobalamin-binding protein [Rivularia sp. PCC 7116]AFY58107.1 ABC-type Fe3+-hydroxamate transport system, periplasmic component [Rivularia sp. PCC 7116]